MGRTATFDRADAVRAARGVFWDRGYEATSIPDLEQATGLKRSSLYHAFESKKGLFDEVVENYLAESVRPLLARITSEEAKPDALNDYFATLASSISSTDRHPGCLLIAAANAPVGTDPVVSAAISGYYDELFAAFRAGLGRARPHLTEAETGSQARTLVALTISALALARTNKTLALANLQAAQALLAATALPASSVRHIAERAVAGCTLSDITHARHDRTPQKSPAPRRLTLGPKPPQTGKMGPGSI